MRTFVKISLVSAAVVAVACGPSEPEQGAQQITDDLQRDLQAASAATVELAATARDYQPRRFVSAIEAPPPAAAPARRSSAPRRVPRSAARQPEAARAPDVTQVAQVEATAPAQVQEQTTEAPAPAPAPEAAEAPTDVAVAPRPTPVEATIPAPGDASGRGNGGGIGEDIGTVIGVVIIRGGAGGIDHCVPRRPGRRAGEMPGIPIAIDTRIPGGIGGRLPIPGRGTFPRR